MHTILEVHNRFNALIIDCFHHDVGFVSAMDKAFTIFVNENHVTKLANSYTKSAELVARYCDKILRKSTRNAAKEVEMDVLLTSIVNSYLL